MSDYLNREVAGVELWECKWCAALVLPASFDDHMDFHYKTGRALPRVSKLNGLPR